MNVKNRIIASVMAVATMATMIGTMGADAASIETSAKVKNFTISGYNNPDTYGCHAAVTVNCKWGMKSISEENSESSCILKGTVYISSKNDVTNDLREVHFEKIVPACYSKSGYDFVMPITLCNEKVVCATVEFIPIDGKSYSSVSRNTVWVNGI